MYIKTKNAMVRRITRIERSQSNSGMNRETWFCDNFE